MGVRVTKEKVSTFIYRVRQKALAAVDAKHNKLLDGAIQSFLSKNPTLAERFEESERRCYKWKEQYMQE